MNTLAIPDLLGTSPADLIDRYVDQPVATRDVAVRRAERIRTGVASYAAMRQDIADAYACRDWLALDYGSWHAYVEGEFGEQLRELGRTDRREAVRDLRTQGMSMPQIAKATGVGVGTVHRELSAAFPNGKGAPTEVTGTDGKTYAATRPEPPARRDPEPTTPGPAVATTGGPDTTEPERPKPPTWDPEDRKRHEEEVRRNQAIDAAHRTAETIVTTVLSEVSTIVAGCRYGEKGLVTRDMIRALRDAIDLLEGEL